MSDAINEIIQYKDYIYSMIRNKVKNFRIILDENKLNVMLEQVEKTGKMECFCGVDKPCPCDKVNEDLDKYDKCHCNFIKAVK